jgi:hypothetical protein
VRAVDPYCRKPRRRRLIAAGNVLAATILAGTPPLAAASDRVGLRADAGLGGAARPGRWTPVRVQIDSKDRDLSGEVVVEWGDARVHRAIDVPAASRTAFELYVRTADVRGSLTVRVVEHEANGATRAKDAMLASVELPIRIIADEEALTVCAGSGAEPPVAGAAPCTTSMAPEALPRSLRGYVAADAVRLLPGAEARLTPAQRTALVRWRAYHELQTHDFVAQAPRAPLGAATLDGAGRPAALAAGTALTLLLGAAWIWTRGRASAARSYLALAGATVLGVVAATAAGRFGPGSQIEVRHSTTVEQVGNGALVSMRGTIAYPAFGGYAMRVLGLDGEVTPRRGAPGEVWLDSSGAPIRRGTFGRGAREEIDVDGTVDYAPFEVRVEGNVVRVRNGSDTTLTDCSFPEGFSARRAGALAPGTSISAEALSPSDMPFFSCALTQPPLTFAEARFPVRVEGVAIVSVRLPDPIREPALE